jgi:hypothetical protein
LASQLTGYGVSQIVDVLIVNELADAIRSQSPTSKQIANPSSDATE